MAGAFVITVGGWWLWNIFLSLAYDPYNRIPFSVRRGFLEHFGKDGSWWCSLIVAVALLAIAELGPPIYRRLVQSQTARRYLVRFRLWDALAIDDDADVGLWQEMEKDLLIRQRLRELANDDDSASPIPGLHE